MGEYRLYFLDEGGRVATFMAIDCEEDAAAVQTAAGVGHRHGMELWEGARLVQRFEPPARS